MTNFWLSNELISKNPVPITIKSRKTKAWDTKFCAKTEKKIKNKPSVGRKLLFLKFNFWKAKIQPNNISQILDGVRKKWYPTYLLLVPK